ncbi:MAG TPA: glycosyltransferase family 9 protein, partial [Candidatus Omnitrophota bacterium]|nr:glycosyltransferase family 9 protein [Candidatus Omnitrophota bacterium]
MQKKADIVDCILGPRTQDLLKDIPYLDEIFVIDKDKWKNQSKINTFIDKVNILKALKKKEYTILLDFSMQPEYSFWGMFHLRIPLRYGFDYKKRNKFLTSCVKIPDEGFSKKHVIEYFCDVGSLLGIEIEDKKPDIKAKKHHIEVKNKYVIISPGGGATWGKDAVFKRWPVEFFSRFMDLLKARVDFEEALILGSEKEVELGEYLNRNLKIRSRNLCGKTTLSEA